MAGLPAHRIITARPKTLYGAEKVVLPLHSPPFNVLQGHWPAYMLVTARDNCIRSLYPNHRAVNSTCREDGQAQDTVIFGPPVPSSSGLSSSSRNLVIYLWRSGVKRGVRDQHTLVAEIEQRLSPGLLLVVSLRTIFPNMMCAGEDMADDDMTRNSLRSWRWGSGVGASEGRRRAVDTVDSYLPKSANGYRYRCPRRR